MPYDQLGAMLSPYPWTNPYMWTWNRAYLMYCDGGMWTSDLGSPVHAADGSTLYFRGRRNLDALLQLLLDSHGLDKVMKFVPCFAWARKVLKMLIMDCSDACHG